MIISRSFNNLKKNNIKKFINNNPIIDVRLESEFNSWNFEGSVNVPLKGLIYRVNGFEKRKNISRYVLLGYALNQQKSFLKREDTKL